MLFVMGADMFSLPMLLPAIAAEFQAIVAHSAMVVVAFGAAYAACAVPSSRLLRTYRHSTVTGIGLTIATVAALAGAAAPSLDLLLLARIVSGVAAAITNPSIWSWLDALAPPGRRGRVVLVGTAVSATGQVAGIPLGAALGAAGAWRLELVVLAAALLSSCIATRAVPTVEPPGGPLVVGAPQYASGSDRRLWADRAFVLALTANVSAQAARLGSYSVVAVLLVQRYHMRDLGLAGIGVVAGTGSLVGAASASALISRWLRRGRAAMGFAAACTPLLLVGVASFTAPLATPLATPLAGLLGLALSFAAGIVVFGTTQLHMTSRYPGNRAAVAWNSSAMYVGAALGTLVLGRVPGGYEFTGVAALFVLVSAVTATWAARI